MLDHEERFLFREEILNLANALNEPGALDNVEALLAEVTTSPRFDSDVFTLERSLQVMLGNRAGSTLVVLLTVTREVFEEVGEIGLSPEVHERVVSWRARFGLAIDNALNFLNNPDGIQGHNFATQIAHVEERRVLQGRLTLVRYNNEPQFFVADAGVFLGRVAMHQLYLAATGQNRGKTTAALGLFDGFVRQGLRAGFMKPVGQRTVIDHGQPADEDAVLMHEVFDLAADYRNMSPVHIPRGFTKSYIAGDVVEDLAARIRDARDSFLDQHDILLIEGTGHAGVGAVIGLS